jgi:hypothetical protein
MGTCKYCNQKVGFLKDAHPECSVKYNGGWQEMIRLATVSAQGEADPISTKSEIEVIAKGSYVPEDRVRDALIEGWEKALSVCLEDSVLSIEEEASLMHYAHQLGLQQDDLNKHGAYFLAGQSAILREVLEGRIPSRVTFDGYPPFHLAQGETLMWYQENCGYMNERVRRSYVGGHHGVSVKIANGVYYRVGAFKGHPVETSAMELIDVGKLGISDKQIYFVGVKKAFRVPYKKIIAFYPYSDGFGFFKDSANARQEVLVTGDGWFYINLVENLAKL